MSTGSITLITLVAYKLFLIGIGVWASRRTSNEADFFLGGRSLGPVVAALSYSSSASSAWTLLGMSGLAYAMGVGALWIAAGSVLGMLFAWIWIAPRLMRMSREGNLITLTDLLLGDIQHTTRRIMTGLISLIIVVSFSFYVAAQFQGAGTTFAGTFDMSMSASITTGAFVVLVYTLLGGFWAVSVTDSVQGMLMAITALLLPAAALQAVGGWSELLNSLAAVSSPSQMSLTAGNVAMSAAGFVVGLLSVGISTCGQPHLLVRFMALRDERALRQARVMTIAWYLVVFFGMCLLGLAGHVLIPDLANAETVFFALTETLFPPLLSAMLIAAVLSAIMSTADSQLLVAASALSHDLGFGRGSAARSLLVSRLSIALLVTIAVLIALYVPEKIFSRALFAWVALGSAFGPLVLARLARWPVPPMGALVSVALGFSTAVALYLAPDTPGDIAERLLPFCLAGAVLLIGRLAAPGRG